MNKKGVFLFSVLFITVTLLIVGRGLDSHSQNPMQQLPQTGSSSALISSHNPFVHVCLSAASEKKLSGMYALVGNKQVSLYNELLNLGAHCDKNNRLFDSRNKEIYIYQRHECSTSQKSNIDTVQIREQENQEIKNIQQSSIVLVLECQLE